MTAEMMKMVEGCDINGRDDENGGRSCQRRDDGDLGGLHLSNDRDGSG